MLGKNSMERSNMYFQNLECMFQKITFKLPKPLTLKERRKKLPFAIGFEWYMNKLNENLPPLRKRKLSKKYKKRMMK